MPIPAAHRLRYGVTFERLPPTRSNTVTGRFESLRPGPDNDLRLLNVSTAAVTRSSLRVTGHACR